MDLWPHAIGSGLLRATDLLCTMPMQALAKFLLMSIFRLVFQNPRLYPSPCPDGPGLTCLQHRQRGEKASCCRTTTRLPSLPSSLAMITFQHLPIRALRPQRSAAGTSLHFRESRDSGLAGLGRLPWASDLACSGGDFVKQFEWPAHWRGNISTGCSGCSRCMSNLAASCKRQHSTALYRKEEH